MTDGASSAFEGSRCPGCGAALRFESRFSLVTECGSCGSTIFRKGPELENLGKRGELHLGMSPLQLGTKGRHDGQSFTLIGYRRVLWDEGAWDEWYVCFPNERMGWLAHAQGFYALSFEHLATRLPERAKLVVGGLHTFDKQHFWIDDIKPTHVCVSAGELPYRPSVGRVTLSVDLRGKDGSFACLEYDNEETRLYLGKYHLFEDLSFTNLRKLDGW